MLLLLLFLFLFGISLFFDLSSLLFLFPSILSSLPFFLPSSLSLFLPSSYFILLFSMICNALIFSLSLSPFLSQFFIPSSSFFIRFSPFLPLPFFPPFPPVRHVFRHAYVHNAHQYLQSHPLYAHVHFFMGKYFFLCT